MHHDRIRARKIVLLAASRTKVAYAREWLRRDERGVWEQRALSLLDETSERAHQLGLDDEDVDRQIAIKLEHDALDAMVAERRKRRV